MKKILGILAICFIGLFILASCDDNKTVKPTDTEPSIVEPTTSEPTTIEPEISEPTAEPETTTPTETTSTEVTSGTVLFNLATAEEKDIKTITFKTNGVEAEYLYKVELHRESDDMNFIVCATKLVQYDTYFEIEFWQAGEWGSLTCDYNEYQYTIMK